MTDAFLFRIPIYKYPKIMAWMDACENAPGIKEVHIEWMNKYLTEMQAKMNPNKNAAMSINSKELFSHYIRKG